MLCPNSRQLWTVVFCIVGNWNVTLVLYTVMLTWTFIVLQDVNRMSTRHVLIAFKKSVVARRTLAGNDRLPQFLANHHRNPLPPRPWVCNWFLCWIVVHLACRLWVVTAVVWLCCHLISLCWT